MTTTRVRKRARRAIILGAVIALFVGLKPADDTRHQMVTIDRMAEHL